MGDCFKYDVALSFLQEDEQLALEIADRIRERVTVKVFLYSERQSELSGSDGTDNFSRVFGEEARMVIVLYREQWGHTSWTRIEETAIKTRGFDDGLDFVLLVKLDSARPPRWMPPTRIWLDFETYGIDGIASVVEKRMPELGGAVQNETVLDHAARLGREISFKGELTAWRSSPEGTEDAKAEADRVVSEFKRLAEEINQQQQAVQVNFKLHELRHCVLFVSDPRVSVEGHYFNSQMKLEITLYEPSPTKYGQPVGDPEIIEQSWYDVSLNRARQIGWTESEGEQRFFTSIQLVANWVKRLLKEVERREFDD